MRSHIRFPLRALAVAAALGALPPTLPAQPQAPASAAQGCTPSAAAPCPYRSAFDGYRRHADQPLVPWREANDRVGRLGGWKTYSRDGEASGQASAPARSATAASAASGGAR
jgi:hypothetical protein